MVNDRRYKRYFIILENEDRGFEKTDKRVPKGYAKIEVRNGKGLLNVYVQDLKYFKDAKYIYRNYLISTKGQNGFYVDTGAFVIDEKGKGELKVKFNPDNVEGSKRAIEDFNIVAVVAQPINRSDQERDIYGPLVGYMDKKKSNWKDVIVYEENNMKTKDDLDEEYKEKYEEIINVIEKSSKELYKDDTDKTGDNKKETEKEENKAKDKKEEVKYKKEYKDHKAKYYENKESECVDCVDSLEKYDNIKMKEEKKEEIKEEKKPEKEPEKKPEMKPEVKPEKKPAKKPIKKVYYKKGLDQKDIKEEKVEKKEKVDYKKENNDKPVMGKKSNVHYKKYHKMVYKYVKDMLKYYEKAQPFEKNINDYKWWKIPYDKQSMHRGFLPFFGYLLNIYYYNPYIYYMNNCENLMNKYGHYIFGIAYDKDMESKYYVYGVPGRYMYKDQPFQGMTGFVCWYPIEDKKPEKGDYGYWLLHIDAKTGNVIFPMKPTIPPMY